MPDRPGFAAPFAKSVSAPAMELRAGDGGWRVDPTRCRSTRGATRRTGLAVADSEQPVPAVRLVLCGCMAGEPSAVQDADRTAG